MLAPPTWPQLFLSDKPFPHASDQRYAPTDRFTLLLEFIRLPDICLIFHLSLLVQSGTATVGISFAALPHPLHCQCVALFNPNWVQWSFKSLWLLCDAQILYFFCHACSFLCFFPDMLINKFVLKCHNYLLRQQARVFQDVWSAVMASGGAPVSAPGAVNLATKVELTVSCENLMDMDVFSKSDPLCALYLNTGSHWYEVCIGTFTTSRAHSVFCWSEIIQFFIVQLVKLTLQTVTSQHHETEHIQFYINTSVTFVNSSGERLCIFYPIPYLAVLLHIGCLCRVSISAYYCAVSGTSLAAQRWSSTVWIPSSPRSLCSTTILRWCSGSGFACTTSTMTRTPWRTTTSSGSWSARLVRWVFHGKRCCNCHSRRSPFFLWPSFPLVIIINVRPDCLQQTDDSIFVAEGSEGCRSRHHHSEYSHLGSWWCPNPNCNLFLISNIFTHPQFGVNLLTDQSGPVEL